MEQIHSFLNPNSNDKISCFKEKDLKQFFLLLNNYYLIMRNRLGIDKSLTFGLEIEFWSNFRRDIDNALFNRFQNDYDEWYVIDEPAIDGLEIPTPILRDDERDWQAVIDVCNIVKQEGMKKCDTLKRVNSGHIHVGTHVIGFNPISWCNFAKLWIAYENIIYRFSYGEYLTERERIYEYANSSIGFLTEIAEMPYDFDIGLFYENIKKEFSVNFNNVIFSTCSEFEMNNTIEFRCPNGTLNPVVWQNNVNFFIRLLEYARSGNFNDEIVSKRYKEIKKKRLTIQDYRQIYLEQAIELADLIFNNNLDKMYFLRQYLKSFKVGTRALEIAPQFTKK